MAAVFPGADESTPSRSEYFSWINNTNEGPTAAQTAANLRFFRWLRDEYGMQLDIYAFDAGAIDGAGGYGRMDSERFRRQFPEGFAPLAAQAAAQGTRLGLWCGPDGFGDSPADERARHDLMVGLCREHGFALFKMDKVCGQLRPGKQDAFVRMMTACRAHVPELILLNHRLDLGKGLPHATTFLWEGTETYIDVHLANRACATHNRACTLTRGNVPGLKRLTEDHGVCLSSCLDFWEDDLVVQAFGRSLICAPQIYGNPWLLRDDEYPRLARLFNLHRRFRALLAHGSELPAEPCGPHAVSRGDAGTRLIVLRNPTWHERVVELALDRRIGLDASGDIDLIRFHPGERHLGRFPAGATVAVAIPPFRSCLLLATSVPCPEIAVVGCDAEVIRDIPGRPVELDLLGAPGTSAEVRVHAAGRRFANAVLDGASAPALAQGGTLRVDFPGQPLTVPWHRHLGDLLPVPVPADAEALYEATCFAADSNALEQRELERSGATAIAAVQQARDAFFQQPLWRKRHLSDRFLFDDDAETGLGVSHRWFHGAGRVRRNCFRLDLGRPEFLDHLALDVGDEWFLQPLKWQETVWLSLSVDLGSWTRVPLAIGTSIAGAIPGDRPWRYLRLDGCPDLIREVRASHRGVALDRSRWRASNLFARYDGWGGCPAVQAWEHGFTLPEAPAGSYLAIALHGEHGDELASVALRVDGTAWRGAPRRSPSFPANSWECPVVRCTGDSTWYVPVTPDLVGRRLAAVALLLKGGTPPTRLEAWTTAHPAPAVRRRLVLEERPAG